MLPVAAVGAVMVTLALRWRRCLWWRYFVATGSAEVVLLVAAGCINKCLPLRTNVDLWRRYVWTMVVLPVMRRLLLVIEVMLLVFDADLRGGSFVWLLVVLLVVAGGAACDSNAAGYLNVVLLVAAGGSSCGCWWFC